ncbi:MAG: hypothetical protein ACN4GG_11760 [Akkermansiaceae bacterium]
MPIYNVKTKLTCTGAILREYYELEGRRKLRKEITTKTREYRNRAIDPGAYLNVYWEIDSAPATVSGTTTVTKVGDSEYKKEHKYEDVPISADGTARETARIKL